MDGRGGVNGVTMETLRSLFQTSSDGACGVSSEQRVVLWNPAARDMLGFEPREVLGRYCFDVLCGMGEDGCPVCGRQCPVFAAATNMRAASTRNLRVRDKQGRMLWLSVSTVAVPRRWRPEATLVHLFRDVSSYKACHDAVDGLLARIGRPPPALRTTASAAVDDADRPVHLTAREHEVLGLLASGMSTDDLADTLSVSVSTVRNHIHNILGKLDVHSRMEAVMVALRNGVL
jgi:PAS domain S-box-containing protein